MLDHTSGGKVVDDNICGVCRKELSDPCFLPCFHTFCSRCLHRLTYMLHPGRSSFSCPTCGKQSVIPPAGRFPSNFYIGADVQPLSSSLNLGVSQSDMGGPHSPRFNRPTKMCEECELQEEAVARCKNCALLLCQDHYIGHRKSKASSSHSMEDLFTGHEASSLSLSLYKPMCVKRDVQSIEELCQIHKGQELKLYCGTCECLICLYCIVKTHREHQYDFIEEKIQPEKRALSLSCSLIPPLIQKVLEAISRIESLQNDVQIVKDAIIEKYKSNPIDSNSTIINIQNQGLLKQIKLQHQKEELQKAIINAQGSLSFIQSLLIKGSSSDILSFKKSATERLSELNTLLSTIPREPLEDGNFDLVGTGETLVVSSDVFWINTATVVTQGGKLSIEIGCNIKTKFDDWKHLVKATWVVKETESDLEIRKLNDEKGVTEVIAVDGGKIMVRIGGVDIKGSPVRIAEQKKSSKRPAAGKEKAEGEGEERGTVPTCLDMGKIHRNTGKSKGPPIPELVLPTGAD